MSSLNSGEDDADLEFEYLHNFGPRFKKLADMYGRESDSDSDPDVSLIVFMDSKYFLIKYFSFRTAMIILPTSLNHQCLDLSLGVKAKTSASSSNFFC